MKKFELDEKQIFITIEFFKYHHCRYSRLKNQGAVGGRFTYTFTPTNLGLVIKVKCACGEEKDLTDYSDW